jgi:hypothetical protein
MNFNKLAAHRAPSAVIDGVVIRLDGLPDVAFLVRLPSRDNRAHLAAQARLFDDVEIDEKTGRPVGLRPAKSIEITEGKMDAFYETCLVSVDGEEVSPDDWAKLVREYPKVVAELMDKASAMAREVDGEAEEAEKKSVTTLPGRLGGVAS